MSTQEFGGKEPFISTTLDRSRSINVVAQSLPAQLTSLIGREREIEAACHLLRQPKVRLMTITGAGGIGKTRLSIEVASALQADFAAGVCFVPLVSMSDPAQVIPTIARALDVRESGDWPLQECLQMFLRDKALLLLLDNVEQVIQAAPHLSELIASCPLLKILVTSRAVLHVRGEYEFPLSPLAVPNLQQPSTIEQSPACMLFLQRARAIMPEFSLHASNMRAIAEICIRLDGLPLAIELAAARVKLLPPRTLLTKLEYRLPVLTSVAQDVPERQRTLRNTIAWSYDLLDEQEQRLFRRLCIFSGGFSLEAAEQVCASMFDITLPLLDGIASLLDKSLLNQVEQGEGEPRLVMLETIREYGLECLAAHEEMAQAHQAHAACYLALAEQAEPHFNSRGQHAWLQRLELDYENLRAALLWLIEHNELMLALRLCGALWRFWWMRGHVTEGRGLLEYALSKTAAQAIPGPVRAKALNAAGTLIGLQGEFERARALCRESLVLFEAINDHRGTINSIWMLGYIARETGNYVEATTLLEKALLLSRQDRYATGIAYTLEILAAMSFDQGDYTRARALGEESLATSRRSGDTWGTARTLWLTALVILFQGDIQRSHAMLEKSLAFFKEVNDKRGIAYALVMLGYVSFFLDQREQTRALLDESLTRHQEIGDRRGIAWTRFGLGWTDLFEHNTAAAHVQFVASLTLLRELDQKWFIALALEGLAACVVQEGQPQWAARLSGAAEALRTAIGGALSPIIRALYEPFISLARTALGEAGFHRAWNEGSALVKDAALDNALLAPPPAPFQPPVPVMSTYPAGLTAREVEILRLVARGLTDGQVAEKLVISPRTVSTHLTSIYGKIGVSSRSAATRFALEHHLA